MPSTSLVNTASRDLDGHLGALGGKQKAALFILALGPEASANIYKYMSEAEIELLTAQIANLQNVSSSLIQEVISEFHAMVKAQEYITSGGIEYAKQVLEKALGENKAMEIIRKVQTSLQVKGFNILQEVDPNQLMAFLQKEHPQTIALVMTQLNPAQAATVLADLPPPLQLDVMFRLAQMERVAPETIKAVEKVLESRIDFSQGGQRLGGAKAVADILNLVGQRFEKHILNGVAKENPELATEIKNLMFVFEDVGNLDDRSIQKILKEVDHKELALAMKTASDELKNRIMSNMSKRAADLVVEELKYMGPVRLREVEEVQQKIIDIIRRLEDEGQIEVASSEDQMV